MDDESLRRIIAELDDCPDDTEPRSRIVAGKPDPFLFLAANKSGLISLSRTCLIAALSPQQSSQANVNVTRVPETHVQIWESRGDFLLGWIERSETIPIPKEVEAERRQMSWQKDRLTLLGCAIIGFIVLFLLISGVLFWGAVLTG